ncbi:MAG TPA: hypothetical protein VEQ63_08155 [Bryobacteraceae bacterium]|nr:hypothetical protein [Bryobacteraceae bacterium]
MIREIPCVKKAVLDGISIAVLELFGYSVTTSEAMTALTITLGTLAILALVVLAAIRRVAGPAPVSEIEPEWVQGFSITKYRPMLRLLDDADFRFVSNQCGGDSALLKKLRSERREIFRSYLRSLIRDFNKLHMAARMVLAYAPEDRSDLASVLLKQRVAFTIAVLGVEARLALHTLGIGSVDVRALIGSLE